MIKASERFINVMQNYFMKLAKKQEEDEKENKKRRSNIGHRLGHKRGDRVSISKEGVDNEQSPHGKRNMNGMKRAASLRKADKGSALEGEDVSDFAATTGAGGRHRNG